MSLFLSPFLSFWFLVILGLKFIMVILHLSRSDESVSYAQIANADPPFQFISPSLATSFHYDLVGSFFFLLHALPYTIAIVPLFHVVCHYTFTHRYQPILPAHRRGKHLAYTNSQVSSPLVRNGSVWLMKYWQGSKLYTYGLHLASNHLFQFWMDCPTLTVCQYKHHRVLFCSWQPVFPH